MTRQAKKTIASRGPLLVIIVSVLFKSSSLILLNRQKYPTLPEWGLLMTEIYPGRTDDCPVQSQTPKEWQVIARGKNRSAANGLQPWDSEGPKKVPRGDHHELIMTNEVEGQTRLTLIWGSFFLRWRTYDPAGEKKNRQPGPLLVFRMTMVNGVSRSEESRGYGHPRSRNLFRGVQKWPWRHRNKNDETQAAKGWKVSHKKIRDDKTTNCIMDSQPKKEQNKQFCYQLKEA